MQLLHLALALAPAPFSVPTPPTLIGTSQAEAAAGSQTAEERVRAYLEELHARARFPGGSAAVILADGSEVLVCVGVSDLESERPMEPTDRLFSGSIGKTYFAAMALELILAGELALEDRAAKWLGEDGRFQRLPNFEQLTIAQLLRHQSGLPRYVMKPEFWSDLMAAPDRSWRPGEQLDYVAGSEAVHPPGEGWAYSDTNYIVLGLVLEQITGGTVYDYVQEHFVEPLELGVTVPTTERRLAGLVQGYPKMLPNLPERALADGLYAFDPDFEWCGGGYLNTPRSLARWARALYTGRAMDGDYVDLMTASAAAAPMLGPGSRYGLGVILRDTEAGPMLGHDGIFPGYKSAMGYFPELEVAAAFQINTDDPTAAGMPLYRVLVELAQRAGE